MALVRGVVAIFAVGLGVAWATACGDLTGPHDDYELPEPDTSLDPDRLSVGEYIATQCAFGKFGDGLVDLRERDEWALVDVFFGRGVDGPWNGPSSSDIELVRSHRGRVLYLFSIPAVRARMILSRIPDLVWENRSVRVRDVPDATRYDVPLSVGFTRSVGEDDLERIESLGGRVTHVLGSIDVLGVILPDRSIPSLQHRSDVEYVQVPGGGCLD